MANPSFNAGVISSIFDVILFAAPDAVFFTVDVDVDVMLETLDSVDLMFRIQALQNEHSVLASELSPPVICLNGINIGPSKERKDE